MEPHALQRLHALRDSALPSWRALIEHGADLWRVAGHDTLPGDSLDASNSVDGNGSVDSVDGGNVASVNGDSDDSLDSDSLDSDSLDSDSLDSDSLNSVSLDSSGSGSDDSI